MKTAIAPLSALLAAVATHAAADNMASRKFLRSLSILDNVDCNLSVDIGCTVRGQGMAQEQDCESFVMPTLTVENCKAPPITTTMLYNGGNCSQSDNQDRIAFVCSDGEVKPPTEDGYESYITVTDAYNKGHVYHDDWVSVGTEYVLGHNQELMEYGLLIRIYESDQKQELLQTLFYPSPLCAHEYELLNRFGASQVIGYTNDEQGVVSPFASYSYQTNLHVTVSLSGDAESATLDRLGLITTFAGYIPLHRDIKNRTVTLDQPLTVTMPMDVDLTESHRHGVLTQVSGTHNEGPGGDCRAVEFDEFHTGGFVMV